jgi:glycosyltransferase involved in cell wall biosynthesis
LRILILHSRYLSGAVSGENRVIEDEAHLLGSAGHDVRVIAPSPQDADLISRVRAGVSAVWSRAAAQRVAAAVRRRHIDVVHVHNMFPALSPTVVRAARAAGAAVVMTLHNYRLMCLPATFLRDGKVCEACMGRVPWRGIQFRCYRSSMLGSAVLAASVTGHRALGTFDAVTRFLAVSEFVRTKYVEGGMEPSRVRVKDNFTWPTSRRTGPGDYFLYLGRLSDEKGLDTVLQAWRQPIGRLIVAGDGPEAEVYRSGAPPGVEFIGTVPPGRVPSLLAGARALLVPSRWYEASPRSIIEAYAAGVPVIASRIGALPEAVKDGASGFLVPPNDPYAWREAAKRLLDTATSERLGAGAFQLWSERHTPEAGLHELEDAYADALAAV